MKREVIPFPGVDEKIKSLGVPLSAAVRAGDLVYVAGQAPIDPKTGEFVKGDVAVQLRQVLENVRAVLEAANSSLDLVLKVQLYATNAGFFPAINQVYQEYFPNNPPARTFINVGAFPYPFDVEVDCVAVAKNP